MAAQSKVDPAMAILDRFGHSPEGKAYAARSGVPATTLWHRNNGRPSIVQKGASQQYLTPQEEKALVTYLLRMAQNGFPLLVKFARDLAAVIVRQRSSASRNRWLLVASDALGRTGPRPSLNIIPSSRLSGSRHSIGRSTTATYMIKWVDWFTVIGKEINSPLILPENVYNMDETGVLLSVLNSLKVMDSQDDDVIIVDDSSQAGTASQAVNLVADTTEDPESPSNGRERARYAIPTTVVVRKDSQKSIQKAPIEHS
ncbi:hypothetical protein BKA61DRAFT_673667 [Leptodontidium sp. MPI-SDFR-AT-0119]|nr:hypothetical protein BKA61DRAFT_673667 [Leptodontidium sp. MPI-SDFR-AT-0119]